MTKTDQVAKLGEHVRVLLAQEDVASAVLHAQLVYALHHLWRHALSPQQLVAAVQLLQALLELAGELPHCL